MEATATSTTESARTAAEFGGALGSDCTAAITVEAATVASVDEPTAMDVIMRVKTVAEGVPKEAVAGKPGVTEWSACPVPARVKARGTCIFFRKIQIGYTEIL